MSLSLSLAQSQLASVGAPDRRSDGRSAKAPPVLSFDPEGVYISVHALERYVERRNTTSKAAEHGIRRLLGRAATQPLPCLKITREHGATRRFLVGELVLILDGECSRLVTMWRRNRGQRWVATTEPVTPDEGVGPNPDPWQELLEAASDVLSDALPIYGIGSTPTVLTPAMERLNNAVNMIDPPDSDLPN